MRIRLEPDIHHCKQHQHVCAGRRPITHEAERGGGESAGAGALLLPGRSRPDKRPGMHSFQKSEDRMTDIRDYIPAFHEHHCRPGTAASIDAVEFEVICHSHSPPSGSLC